MSLGSSTHCVPRIHDVKDIQTSKFNHRGSSYCYSSLCIDFDKSLIQDVSVLCHYSTYRGSYMSAHFLLILLNELGKEIKCEACRAFYLFRNEFNKFNNTRARMLDSIYHMTLRLL